MRYLTPGLLQFMEANMAICTTVAPFDKISGKFADPTGGGGVVAMPTAGRNLLRQFVVPDNPNTSRQVEIRGYFTAAATSLKALTANDRDEWIAFASNFQRTGRLSLLYDLSWSQAYVLVNVYRQIGGQAISAAVPSFVNLAAATAITGLGEAGGNLDVVFTHSLTPATGFFYIEATTALGSLSRQARDNDFRSPTVPITGSMVAIAASPQNVSLTLSGITINSGDQIGVRILSVSSGYVPGQRLVVRNTTVS